METLGKSHTVTFRFATSEVQARGTLAPPYPPPVFVFGMKTQPVQCSRNDYHLSAIHLAGLPGGLEFSEFKGSN